ncbi:MAG TPA: nitroreductase family protein [Planctomycetota bacterium]
MNQSPARVLQAAADPLFVDRRSARAFLAQPIEAARIAALFEAARWSPSCFNEQPWLFVYSTRGESRAAIAACLAEGNRTWAVQAPLLGVAFARRRFAHNDKANRWAEFDTGAACLAFAQQAHLFGLGVHFMGGFDADAAAAALDAPAADYQAMAAFAVGHLGAPADLPPELREREIVPTPRKPLAEVAQRERVGGPGPR